MVQKFRKLATDLTISTSPYYHTTTTRISNTKAMKANQTLRKRFYLNVVASILL